ncbi:MAG: hypothetical protein L0271_06520 [Gemmatimonadetes bacterium]|nr:hypothetical protein [Gemmatimonadota bacterium]
MTPAVLTRPARVRRPSPAAAPARPRPRDPKWLFPAGLGIAALLHLIALLVIRFTLPGTSRPAAYPPRAIQLPAATEVIALVAVPDIDFVEPPPVLEERPDPTPLPEVRIDAPAATPATPSQPVPTIAERIRSTGTDPRLWTRPDEFPPPVDAFDAMMNRVAGRIAAWNDSSAAAAMAAAKATDWTVTDKNGGRWGVSPGQLHLGSLTLPLPIGFAPPPGRRDETLARVRGWSEIEAQASRAAVRETFDDRVKAIRARNDARRDSTRKAGGDTTRISGR